MERILLNFLVLLHLLTVNLALEQTAYAIYDINADHFTLSLNKPEDDYAAYAIYSNTINQTGWATFEVSTNGNYSDSVQVRAAGFLEGYLSHELIYLNYLNTLDGFCIGNEILCENLNNYLETNTKWAKEMYSASRNADPFWHQVGLFYEQLDGMSIGWNQAAQTTGYSFGSSTLMWLNILGDLDVLQALFTSGESRSTRFIDDRRHIRPSCSALIKVLPDLSDIFISHVTWNSYGSMIRILKKYNLKVHITNRTGSPIIPGHSMSFSSYPGILYSCDDFTIISSDLVSLETTNNIANTELYQFIKPIGQILEGIRSVAANRLANTGEEWTDIFRLHNSGTYNNQWMIVDYKKFQPRKPLSDGLLWVLEQLPSYVEAYDMTSVLRSQLYWASYNVPYFPTVFKLSGQAEMMKLHGSFFSHDQTPRARIFRRDQGNVTDMNSMIKLMRSNNYLEDPLSRCEDCPLVISAENAIASRNDLNPINSTFYSIWPSNPRTYGAIDCKATSSAMIPTLDFIAISGPTYDPLPPFQFSRIDFEDSLPHFGHPDLWKFPAFHTNWTN